MCVVLKKHSKISAYENKNNKIPIPILSPTTPDSERTGASESTREGGGDGRGGGGGGEREREHMHTHSVSQHAVAK
jgi:hypothetical protein